MQPWSLILLSAGTKTLNEIAEAPKNLGSSTMEKKLSGEMPVSGDPTIFLQVIIGPTAHSYFGFGDKYALSNSEPSERSENLVF